MNKKRRIDNSSWLINKPIAHRGLWGGSVVENTRLAYSLAAEKGIPIEIDLYLTKDLQLVSFHDKTLKRMTGVDGNIFDYTLEELQAFKIIGTDETIPTFKEVLQIAEGKCPIMIELKQQPHPGMVEKVVDALKYFKGEYAIQSFDPRYIISLKKIAPDIIRGILSTSYFEKESFLTRFIVSKMALNFLAKPDFISVRYNDYPVKKCKAKNKVKLAWTVTSQEIYDEVKPFVDNVIYEGFEI